MEMKAGKEERVLVKKEARLNKREKKKRKRETKGRTPRVLQPVEPRNVGERRKEKSAKGKYINRERVRKMLHQYTSGNSFLKVFS